jgi:prevent-host-death family protein
VKESTVGASEFKAKCLGLLEEVSKGSTFIITKRGRPIAKISPITTPVKSLRGSWKGIVRIKGDIVNCNEADAWENG